MSSVLSSAPVTNVRIDSIVIGERRRDKLGRLKQLAQSIQSYGLVHPIVLRGTTLVAGHRRLEACRLLQWQTIPARQVDRITDEELRAIELDENTMREALSDYAASKSRLAQIRQTEADLKTKEATEVLAQPAPKPSSGGRPTKAASERAIEAATGISRREQARVEQHVTLAEQYPFMQRRGWQRHHVLDAGDVLATLPAADRAPIAALLDQDAIPPAYALEYLGHAAAMTSTQRHAVIRLAASADEHERREALTTIANVPPPPDPGLLALIEMERDGRKAAKVCRSDQYKARIAALALDTTTLLREFDTHEKQKRGYAAETV